MTQFFIMTIHWRGFPNHAKGLDNLGKITIFFQVAHKIGHSVKFLRNVFQDAQK
jgi:hypothetical protein